MTLDDGTELSPALGIGAFVEKTLVAAGQCTKVDPAVPAATAGLRAEHLLLHAAPAGDGRVGVTGSGRAMTNIVGTSAAAIKNLGAAADTRNDE